MFLSEVAEAAIKTGEVTVELFAGVETVTLTHADANTGNEITHRTIESVHRITSFSPKKCCAQRSGTFRGQLGIRRIFAFCVLVFKVFVRREKSNGGDDPVWLGFFT